MNYPQEPSKKPTAIDLVIQAVQKEFAKHERSNEKLDQQLLQQFEDLQRERKEFEQERNKMREEYSQFKQSVAKFNERNARLNEREKAIAQEVNELNELKDETERFTGLRTLYEKKMLELSLRALNNVEKENAVKIECQNEEKRINSEMELNQTALEAAMNRFAPELTKRLAELEEEIAEARREGNRITTSSNKKKTNTKTNEKAKEKAKETEGLPRVSS